MTLIFSHPDNRLIGHTTKQVCIASPMHARAILTQSECKALGIERATMIACRETPKSIPHNGLTFDGEQSFEVRG